MAQEPQPDPQRPAPGGEPGPTSQEIRHAQVSARVPEKIGRGVFSTGAVVLQGAHEFIIDFLLRMTSPQQVAARVVLPPVVMGQFAAALRENLGHYQRNFGGPPQAPTPRGPVVTPPKPPPVEELYDQLKLPDDVLSGVYANAVMISHTPTEFAFDFITTFYPRSAVSCRIFLAAPNVPRFLESLAHSFEQYQRRRRPPESPPAPPTSETPPAGEETGGA